MIDKMINYFTIFSISNNYQIKLFNFKQNNKVIFIRFSINKYNKSPSTLKIKFNHVT